MLALLLYPFAHRWGYTGPNQRALEGQSINSAAIAAAALADEDSVSMAKLAIAVKAGAAA